MGVERVENGIICGTAMAEMKLENGKVRYWAACPTRRERFKIGRRDFRCGSDPIVSL